MQRHSPRTLALEPSGQENGIGHEDCTALLHELAFARQGYFEPPSGGGLGHLFEKACRFRSGRAATMRRECRAHNESASPEQIPQ